MSWFDGVGYNRTIPKKLLYIREIEPDVYHNLWIKDMDGKPLDLHKLTNLELEYCLIRGYEYGDRSNYLIKVTEELKKRGINK